MFKNRENSYTTNINQLYFTQRANGDDKETIFNIICTDTVGGKESEDETEEVDSEDEVADVMDSSIFDNLTWEVECTAQVWKLLRDKRVQQSMKQVKS